MQEKNLNKKKEMHLEKQKEKKIFEHSKGAYKRKKMEEYR
jgi:hypothetical protein